MSLTAHSHVPVMPDEVIEQLRPGPDEIVIDATVGSGGHAYLIWREMRGSGTLVAIDRDPEMIEIARRRFLEKGIKSESVRWIVGSFADLTQHLAVLGIERINRILYDFGLNSAQLDNPDRGFSFQANGPLDARFNRLEPIPTLAERLARIDERKLEAVLREFGDERWARRIARAIVRQRKRKPIETTEELARVVRSAVRPPRGRRRIDAATRCFQSLRILTNNELEHIERGLEQALRTLAPGGRIVTLCYQSAEDRLVKQAFRRYDVRYRKEEAGEAVDRERPRLKILTRRPLRPSEEERRRNRRSRSARLRAAERIS